MYIKYPVKKIPLLRNSERSDFKRCPWKWNWRWNENLVPIDFSVGPLIFGSFGHLALAEHYRQGFERGPHPAETWDQITQDYMDAVKTENYMDDDLEMSWLDARALGRTLLENYVNHYGADDHWEVLWVEKPGKQLVPHPLNSKEAIVNYCFTIDLVVRDHLHNGRIRLVDHKFMKAIETRHLQIDDQNSGYLAIGTHSMRQEGLIGPKEAIRDMVYNFIRKAVPPDREQNQFGEYLNKDGTVSKRQPPAFFERFAVSKTTAERNHQIVRIGQEALTMKAYRQGKLPLYKTPNRDCTWQCQYFSLCQVDESGGDVERTKKMLFRQEDAYQEYYKDAISPKRLADQ